LERGIVLFVALLHMLQSSARRAVRVGHDDAGPLAHGMQKPVADDRPNML